MFCLFAVGCSPVGATSDDDSEPRASGGQYRVIESSALDDGVGLSARTEDNTPEALVDSNAGFGTEDPDSEQTEVEEPVGTIVAHVVDTTITAYEAPDITADQIERFSNPTEYGGPLVFQALGPAEEGWLEVLLPIRPNGTTGWVEADQVELTINPYRIEIDASAYELIVYRNDEQALSTTVAIGNGNTPTPLGNFYLVELLRPSNQDGPYGSFAYGLSGHSETLDSFNGGDGGIGIHGTNRPDLLGQDVSHGCIRVANPTIEEMVEFLPLGTPVHIFRSAEETA